MGMYMYCKRARTKQTETCLNVCVYVCMWENERDILAVLLETLNGRPWKSVLFKFRIALWAVSASRYSQNPYPFGLPVSWWYTIVNLTTGPTLLNISVNSTSVASWGIFPTKINTYTHIYTYVITTREEITQDMPLIASWSGHAHVKYSDLIFKTMIRWNNTN